MDTETTAKNQLVFDFAYNIFDRHGFTYLKNAFLFKDVLAQDDPFYKDKIANYWTLAYKKLIKPVSARTARKHFNYVLQNLENQNYELVLTAYNAAFDIRALGFTSRHMIGKPWLAKKGDYKFFDIWHGWVAGCPKDYGNFAELTPKGNLKTNAENVFRYESGDHNFIERHVAYSDAEIEKFLLLKILRRKKKLHIVDNPDKFVAHPWKIAQERCRIAIEHRKNKQESLQSIIETVPDLTISKDHQLKMSLEDKNILNTLRNSMLDEG